MEKSLRTTDLTCYQKHSIKQKKGVVSIFKCDSSCLHH